MTDRDRATIIAFGASPVVERPLSTARQIGPIASIVDGGKTDIAGAIRLALATLPSTMARKIVVVSDGNENTGKAIEQARVSSAAGVPIQVVPLAQQAGPEVLVRTGRDAGLRPRGREVLGDAHHRGEPGHPGAGPPAGGRPAARAARTST